jgi:hypothetical protein
MKTTKVTLVSGYDVGFRDAHPNLRASKYTLISLHGLVLLMIFLFGTCRAEAYEILRADPLVHLAFDRENVVFETAPSAIGELIINKYNVQLNKQWLFATFVDPSTNDQYFIVAGMMVSKDPRMKDQLVEDPGVIAKKTGDRYQILGDARPDQLFHNNIPEAVINGLVHDYVDRLIRAWGSKEKVMDAITRNYTGKDMVTDGIAPLSKQLADEMRERGITNVCVHHGRMNGPGYCTEPDIDFMERYLQRHKQSK